MPLQTFGEVRPHYRAANFGTQVVKTPAFLPLLPERAAGRLVQVSAPLAPRRVLRCLAAGLGQAGGLLRLKLEERRTPDVEPGRVRQALGAVERLDKLLGAGAGVTVVGPGQHFQRTRNVRIGEK